MFQVSQKCQYALRAILELADRQAPGPTSVGEIAEAQAIPPRFLELILTQLRKAGFVASRRGVGGGYELAVSPRVLTVGAIIRCVDGPLVPVVCVDDGGQTDCPLRRSCAFLPMWQQAREAVEAVYDTTTFQDLLDARRAADGYVANYVI